jgi:hypothetical protein
MAATVTFIDIPSVFRARARVPVVDRPAPVVVKSIWRRGSMSRELKKELNRGNQEISVLKNIP